MKQKKYNIIYADPPWTFRVYSPKGNGRSAAIHYPTMNLEAIKDLPVEQLADRDCTLFLWVTFPNLRESFEVIRSWGFTFKTVAFVWIKQNRKSESLFWVKEEERTLFRRRHISLVLQEGALLPGLTVEENILLPMAMDTGRLVEEERLEQILEALGLTRLRRRFPARLSGGERQRVVLGRALLSDAEIILADEPCARLDRRQSLEIMGLLKECAGTWNRTVLMATHDLDLAQICDQILVLRDGQIFPW